MIIKFVNNNNNNADDVMYALICYRQILYLFMLKFKQEGII